MVGAVRRFGKPVARALNLSVVQLAALGLHGVRPSKDDVFNAGVVLFHLRAWRALRLSARLEDLYERLRGSGYRMPGLSASGVRRRRCAPERCAPPHPPPPAAIALCLPSYAVAFLLLTPHA